MKRVNLELPDDLLARVDEAAGDIPRNRWLRRAVERALEEERSDQRHRDQYAARERFHQHVPGLNVEHVRSSSQAKRNVQPIPKQGKR